MVLSFVDITNVNVNITNVYCTLVWLVYQFDVHRLDQNVNVFMNMHVNSM